ncbi:MAG: hypothetical protein ACK56I_17205, partial [bacterium]
MCPTGAPRHVPPPSRGQKVDPLNSRLRAPPPPGITRACSPEHGSPLAGSGSRGMADLRQGPLNPRWEHFRLISLYR